MTELIFFWTVIALATAVLLAITNIYGENAERIDEPPRSHEPDDFERTGSSWH